MRVIHIADAFLRISENWIYPQVFGVRGVTPAVLCDILENTAQFPLQNAPVFFDTPPWRSFLGIPRIANSLAFRAGHPLLSAGIAARRWKPDLLHAHFGTVGWAMLPLKKRLRVPMITSFYGIDAWAQPQQSTLWRARYRDLFEKGDVFVAEGPAMGERLKAIGCPSEKIRIVRIGVNADELCATNRKPASPPRVLMMARFTEKKGFADGLRACLEARKLGADFSVTIVGDAVAGDESGTRIKTELHEIAAQPELAGRVNFTGFVPVAKSREILRAHDIYLCPSKHAASGDAEGGSPVALTEAMALGLLCIGTRHCDIPEVIRHGETGLLAESGDVDGIAALLAGAIKNPEGSRALCQRGRAHVAENFSTAAQVGALEKIYAALAGAPGQKK
jgi:colanic acid/amylovoran biosynthesis glycosyltransferase